MNIIEYLFELTSPIIVIGCYLVLFYVKKHTPIKSKFYGLIASVSGIILNLIDSIIITNFSIKIIITGILSGIIALYSYDYINSLIKKIIN